MRIYIVGFMGAGKSTAGKKLASKMGYSFTDLDRMIEMQYKTSIPGLFSKYDESLFRNLERKALHSTFSFQDAVVSTGGGTPCYFDNMELINREGISVFIEMSVKALADRLRNSKKPRPLVRELDRAKLEEQIAAMLEERITFYEKADLRIKGENLDINHLHSELLSLQAGRSQKHQ